jgi:hypothetical protein
LNGIAPSSSGRLQKSAAHTDQKLNSLIIREEGLQTDKELLVSLTFFLHFGVM